jgi:hypothetical protein
MIKNILILLAGARAAGVMDALDIKAVCEVPTDGGPRKIYLDMDAEAFETLAGRANSDAARATVRLRSTGTSGPRLATMTPRG